MLLEFRFQNYKSFCEETTLSMTADPEQKGLDYSLFNIKNHGRDMSCLCSSVIYGPNAAGKSTVVSAMDTFRSIVLRGNIRNSEGNGSPNHAASYLSLIPNQILTHPEPVAFFIDFVFDSYRIQYGVVMDLGLFLDAKHERNILSEVLTVNGSMIFERKSGSLKVEPCKELAPLFSKTVTADNTNAVIIASESLDREELFLTGGFRLIFSPALVKLITEWFSNQFIIVCRADGAHLERYLSHLNGNSRYASETLHSAVKLFGITANPIRYVTEKDCDTELVSQIDYGDSHPAELPAEIYESYGTIRFINLFSLVIRAIETGATLVVDDFDASIHPMTIMNILNLFHNDELNTKHAQMVFVTHNPVYLNSNLLRRDEIKFVERDSNDHTSTIYSLADFGTGLGDDEDYLKRYLSNMYGAIPDVDFSSLLENHNK